MIKEKEKLQKEQKNLKEELPRWIEDAKKQSLEIKAQNVAL